MSTVVLPSTPVPVTSAGASAVTGNSAIGDRTEFFALVQVSEPVAHCSTGALALSNVIVKVFVWPGRSNLSC